ncbi:hypothetical protein A1Q1_00215 [Trichosporon asahii var. asahii CBS 2479]|uniref:Uncharacterized protein n=1 Tax=Trichosporon asahii var. asahii (strain ATCC 90039 / CBS 2479 / JCM 2466 / KCTC 7840 / NBRC 103889/ NCYC 2677 / UAMH 7654) TaxID=1186058 RepID=J6F0K8_TRIAS|nr:hypothetical protein A1Q1_00215 [Trichosporon asahii var. asahii CBS 2479]EJT50474.1 hypothetical protein A1Q1_00215 [Trichosporon asahii var. asahii CBS 2479]
MAPPTPTKLANLAIHTNHGTNISGPSSARPNLSVNVDRSDTHSLAPSVGASSFWSDKKLPRLPKRKWVLGAYDNKLLPPIPPRSPSGVSATSTAAFSIPSTSPQKSLAPASLPNLPTRYISASPPSSSAGGVLVLPDGTTLATGDNGGRPERDPAPSTSMMHAVAHSSPNSPWSLLTVHVLPVFAGSPLRTPIEDLNSHISSASQRTPASRLVHVLTSDLRDLIASGMFTLKAKFDGLEENKLVSRTAEVWNFFWGQILPIRDVPSSSTARPAAIIQEPPIPVRHILLSAFLLHILLPLLPRLIPLVAAIQTEDGGPDLQRLLQMSLVLSTQARYSSFFPTLSPHEAHLRDEETRESVEELGRAVRWSMAVAGQRQEQRPAPERQHSNASSIDSGNGSAAPTRPTLQRGPSVSQAGRLRRRRGTLGNGTQLDREGRAVSGIESIYEDNEQTLKEQHPALNDSVRTVRGWDQTHRRQDSSGSGSEVTNISATVSNVSHTSRR